MLQTRGRRKGTDAVVLLAAVSLGLSLWLGPALGQLPTIINLDVPFGTESSPVLRIFGDDSSDFLGSDYSGLAFGDVDGDGFDDVIMGAFRADTGGGFDAGEV